MPRDGFLNLLKPPGMTSHDVVALVRRYLRGHRVGHLGTLDPAAAGVLPISVGRATRLFAFAGGPEKDYRAELVFGLVTDTLDAEGKVTAVHDSSRLTEAALADTLTGFAGEIEQTPPRFSAAKVGGRALYELARRGEDPQARRRRVRIHSIGLVAFQPGARARALIDVSCTTGTYLRVLASEIGCVAGYGACLGFLVRTRVSRFDLEHALALEEFTEACARNALEGCLLGLDWPVMHFPAVELGAREERSFTQGARVRIERPPAWPVRVYGAERRFLGLGEVLPEHELRPRVVLAEEGRSSL